MPTYTRSQPRPTTLELIPGQPIQWHLQTSKHDHCPACGGAVGFLGRRHRLCLDLACALTFKLEITTTKWYSLVTTGQHSGFVLA